MCSLVNLNRTPAVNASYAPINVKYLLLNFINSCTQYILCKTFTGSFTASTGYHRFTLLELYYYRPIRLILFYYQNLHVKIEVPCSKGCCSSGTAFRLSNIVYLGFSDTQELCFDLKALIAIKKNP